MLNYNSPINETKDFNNLKMSEESPIMKLVIRGKKREFISKVGKLLNILLPNEPNTSTVGNNITALWLSPDEWMIHSNDKIDKNNNLYPIEEDLINNIRKINLGAITDVTDQFTMIKMEGSQIYELFSNSCPFNFNDFKKKKGAVAQTIINKIDVIIHNKEINVVNLLVRRSFSSHLWSWLNDGAERI